MDGLHAAGAIPLFPTVVRTWDVTPEAVDPDRLRSLIADLRGRPGALTDDQPAAGQFEWMSTTDLHLRDELRELGLVGRTAGLIFLDEGGWEVDDLAMTECWANVSEPGGGGHRGHAHPNSLLSAVYYLDVPEGSGAITFADPRTVAHVIEPVVARRTLESTRTFDLDVRSGLLAVFPSYLSHAVNPNRSTEAPRTSIAFNLLPVGWVGPPTARFHHGGDPRAERRPPPA